MPEVRIDIYADQHGAPQELKKTEDALAGIDAQGGRTSSQLDNLWASIAAGNIVAQATTKTINFFARQLGEAVKGAIEEEEVQHRLITALQLTGRAADGAANDFMGFAKAQMAATTFTDEQVTSTMTLLAQLTKLDNEGIKKATKGAMGLASVLGMDLQSAALMVTKAMEGNLMALQRVGIRIDENIPKSERSAAVLDRLLELYPRATAELETMGGKIKNATNNWKEFLDAWGKSILSTPQMQATIQALAAIAKAAANAGDKMENQYDAMGRIAERYGWVVKGTTAAKKAEEEYNAGIQATVGWISNLTSEFSTVSQTTLDIANGMDGLGEGFRTLADGAKSAEKALADIDDQMKKNEAAWKRMQDANLDLYSSFMAISEIDPASIFPEPGDFEMPTFLQQFVDGALRASNDVQKVADPMAEAWNSALQSMTAGIVSFGDANASVWENVGSVFGNFVKSAIKGIESLMIQQIIAGRKTQLVEQGKAQSSAISNIFSSVHPWWLALIAAAGSFAVVNALFSKVLKFEKGGYFDKATMLPAHVVGEGGPEYYLPEQKLISAVQKGLVARQSDGTLAGRAHTSPSIARGAIQITINAQTLDDAAIWKARTALADAVAGVMRVDTLRRIQIRGRN